VLALPKARSYIFTHWLKSFLGKVIETVCELSPPWW
jgi:hypothetical protein